MSNDKNEFRSGILADYWQDFEKCVIAPNAPSFQRVEMRRAFVAGMCAYAACMGLALDAAAKQGEPVAKFLFTLDLEMYKMAEALLDEPVIAADTIANVSIEVDGEVVAQFDGARIDGDAPRLSVLDIRGLSDDDVSELDALIKGFVADRSKGTHATH